MLSLNCKNVQHVEIYSPWNFKVNPITHFGVISLFSSNFQNFNTFRPLFQKLSETDGLLKHCKVGRSRHGAHICNLNLTSISYRFWNKGRKVLKYWQFDEKRAITPRWVIRFTSKLQANFLNFNTFRPLFQNL
jgi:hypothetical protein